MKRAEDDNFRKDFILSYKLPSKELCYEEVK